MSDDSFHFIPATEDQPPVTATSVTVPAPSVEPVAAAPTRKTEPPAKTAKRSTKPADKYGKPYSW